MTKFDIEQLFMKVRNEIVTKSLGKVISHPRYLLGKQVVRKTSLIINPINSVDNDAMADVEKVKCVSFESSEPIEYEKYVLTIYDTRFNQEDMENILYHEFAHILFNEIYEETSYDHSLKYQELGVLLGKPIEVFNSNMKVPRYIGLQSRYVVQCRDYGIQM